MSSGRADGTNSFDAATIVGLAVVVLLFCAPLFVGLGNSDLANDEAIYSYAVDRIVETGDWLTPRLSPNDIPFFEKPPLKFWLIAGAVQAGVLPHNEFGLRFFDALFGGLGFVYVFFLGRRNSGPLAGVIAVLVLFTFQPLVLDHGLRSNNMEAPLFVAYSAGIYHFSRWVEDARRSRRRLHALAVAACFILAFMTKFVAAVFLPLVCVAALAARPGGWARLRSDWRDWAAAAALVVLACAPWFLYQTVISGTAMWKEMLGVHVFQRFTTAIDPRHVQPWHYYFSQSWTALGLAGSRWICALGILALVADGWIRGCWLSRLLFLWWALPLAAISLGTSKLIHYAYPFLPPLAIGAGAIAVKAFVLLEERIAIPIRRVPEIRGWTPFERLRRIITVERPVWRYVLLPVDVVAVVLAAWTLAYGPIRWTVSDSIVVRNSSVLRPSALAVILLLVAMRARDASRALTAALLIVVLPVTAYPATLRRLDTQDHPLRTLRDCVASVRAPSAQTRVYLAYDQLLSHSFFYYLHAIGPWKSDLPIETTALRYFLLQPGAESLVLMPRADYGRFAVNMREFGVRTAVGRLPGVGALALPINGNVVILLPGPFEPCAVQAAAAGLGVEQVVLRQ